MNDTSTCFKLEGAHSSLKNHNIPARVRKTGVSKMNVSRLICLARWRRYLTGFMMGHSVTHYFIPPCRPIPLG